MREKQASIIEVKLECVVNIPPPNIEGTTRTIPYDPSPKKFYKSHGDPSKRVFPPIDRDPDNTTY